MNLKLLWWNIVKDSRCPFCDTKLDKFPTYVFSTSETRWKCPREGCEFNTRFKQ